LLLIVGAGRNVNVFMLIQSGIYYGSLGKWTGCKQINGSWRVYGICTVVG
jgi:hypothetical protein